MKTFSLHEIQKYDVGELANKIFSNNNVVNSLVLNAVAKVTHYELEKFAMTAKKIVGNSSTRKSYWGPEYGWMDVPVYKREELKAGNLIIGPALIDAKDTTYVIPHRYFTEIDCYLNALIKEDI
jgi:N-methylhydantoinase A/oxoprolinase/acetone carboxylase beta subunit